MNITEPKVEDRNEQYTAGIRSVVAMEELSTVIPAYNREVAEWLGQQGMAPTGPPFIRYYVINMPGSLEVEIGWPVEAPFTGNGRILSGKIPAGRYASLIYTGVENGIQ